MLLRCELVVLEKLHSRFTLRQQVDQAVGTADLVPDHAVVGRKIRKLSGTRPATPSAASSCTPSEFPDTRPGQQPRPGDLDERVALRQLLTPVAQNALDHVSLERDRAQVDTHSDLRVRERVQRGAHAAAQRFDLTRAVCFNLFTIC